MRTNKLHASVLSKATSLSQLSMASGKTSGFNHKKDRLYNASLANSQPLSHRKANGSEFARDEDAAARAADAVTGGEAGAADATAATAAPFYIDLGKRRRTHVSSIKALLRLY